MPYKKMSFIQVVTLRVQKIQKVDIDEKDLNVSAQAEEQLADYRNIAIFGIDSREDTYNKGNRSDCIIIASINNKINDNDIINAISLVGLNPYDKK